MSEAQEIIALIANAAEEVGDKPFEAALRKLNEYFSTLPEESHKDLLKQMWGKEEKVNA